MEKKEYVITFMGKGNDNTVLNITRAIKNEGFEIINSEHQITADTLAGFILVPGKPQDTAPEIEQRITGVISRFEGMKFFIQNAKLFNYIYTI